MSHMRFHDRQRGLLVPVRVAAALLLAVACGRAADEPASVKTFLAERDKWERLQGTTLSVEGRWSIFNDERLLLTKCDLVFVFDNAVRVPASKTKNVEVTGRLETREGALVFRVTRLQLRPSDLDTVGDRRARLETNDPQGWYDLANWATERGRFYEDEELLKEAADLSQTGVIVEYRKIPPTAVDPLFALAQKANRLGLPRDLHDRMIHDALRRELASARRGKPELYNVVLTHILERLADSDVRLTLDEATLEQQRLYREDPLAVYEQADEDQRRTLHRLLYAEVALEQIEGAAAADGSNGFEVARRIEQTVPEHAALAEEYRSREITWQIEHVPELTRENLLTLAARLDERDETARAEEVKRRWLDAREPTWRGRGINGKLDLAEEYIQLLGDEAAAAEVYKEIFREPAGQETARTKLVELGYRFDGADWVSADADPGDPTADAIRRGVVRRDMTDSEVQAALGGRPDSVVRFASRGQVTEVWVYRSHGVSIRFNRRNAADPRTVVEICDLSRVGSE